MHIIIKRAWKLFHLQVFIPGHLLQNEHSWVPHLFNYWFINYMHTSQWVRHYIFTVPYMHGNMHKYPSFNSAWSYPSIAGYFRYKKIQFLVTLCIYFFQLLFNQGGSISREAVFQLCPAHNIQYTHAYNNFYRKLIIRTNESFEVTACVFANSEVYALVDSSVCKCSIYVATWYKDSFSII